MHFLIPNYHSEGYTSLSGKIEKFDFHPGNLSMAGYTYEKPPKKVSGFVGHPVTRATNF